jgi:hypothetical protein
MKQNTAEAVKSLCVAAILTAALNFGQAHAQSSQDPSKKQAESSDAKKAAEFLKARIAFVGFLNAAYQKQGYRLLVQANGPDKRTLEISSALLWEGSQTMEAALEVLTDDDIYANVKHLRFTKIVFTGYDFSTSYSIADGIARRIR